MNVYKFRPKPIHYMICMLYRCTRNMDIHIYMHVKVKFIQKIECFYTHTHTHLYLSASVHRWFLLNIYDCFFLRFISLKPHLCVHFFFVCSIIVFCPFNAINYMQFFSGWFGLVRLYKYFFLYCNIFL